MVDQSRVQRRVAFHALQQGRHAPGLFCRPTRSDFVAQAPHIILRSALSPVGKIRRWYFDRLVVGIDARQHFLRLIKGRRLIRRLGLPRIYENAPLARQIVALWRFSAHARFPTKFM